MVEVSCSSSVARRPARGDPRLHRHPPSAASPPGLSSFSSPRSQGDEHGRGHLTAATTTDKKIIACWEGAMKQLNVGEFEEVARGLYVEGLAVDHERGVVWFSDVIGG